MTNYDSHVEHDEFPADEGGLRPPTGLSFWRRAWWWFDFLILVKLARLRFIGILLVIGLIITQWDLLMAYYKKWTRSGETTQVNGDVEYFCPMHPAVIRDNPKDKCPICFMPLSKRKKGEVTTEVLPDGVVNRVQLSPYRVVLAGVQTWKVDYLPLVKEINAVGTVEFNERNQTTVAARMNGRIDELLASETGQIVSKGDVLASIYSPDLVVTMQNLLQAKKAGNNSLVNDARTKLELLGISKDQIDEILETGKANTHLKIRSPISGHVIRKYVREGQYVQEGMALYDVVDLATVWIQAQVYEDDVEFLPVRQVRPSDMSEGPEVVATTRAFPNEEFHGRLRFIYPHVDQRTRTLTVRFELDNPGHKLRPGSTATVKLRVSPADVSSVSTAIEEQGGEAERQLLEGNVLAVPDGSVIDTGNQKIVYRETLPGVYEGVQVKLGPRMSDAAGAVLYPVIAGVAAGERVVTSGSFLVDAETRLNPAAGSIYFGGSGGSQSSGPTATVRSTTPEDPDAKIHAALVKLPPEDRKLAEAQRFCPILEGSRLGSMGVPIKLMLEGRPVFVCCSGCPASAKKNPAATLEKVDKLLKKANEKAPDKQKPTNDKQAKLEREIAAELAKLSPADRRLVELQRFCVVSEDSRLGSMGAPIKLMIDGEPVFLCCEGCETAAREDAAATVKRVRALRAEREKP